MTQSRSDDADRAGRTTRRRESSVATPAPMPGSRRVPRSPPKRTLPIASTATTFVSRFVLEEVVAAAAERPGRARRDEEPVELSAEGCVDLGHRLRLCGRGIGLVRVLVRPPGARSFRDELFDQSQTRREEIAGARVRLDDDANLGAQVSDRVDLRSRPCGESTTQIRLEVVHRGMRARARSRGCLRWTRRRWSRRPMRPSASASAIIRAAERSFELPPGFSDSSFAQSSMSRRSENSSKATSGVFPIAPRTPCSVVFVPLMANTRVPPGVAGKPAGAGTRMP